MHSSSTLDTRRKNHKAGKVFSLSILWVAVGVVVISGAITYVNMTFNNVQNTFDRDVVAVTDSGVDSDLQPMSAKIVASSNSSMMNPQKAINPEDYKDVWAKLETLAPPSATPAERLLAIETFLSGLNYKMVTRGGLIVSISDGNQINPSTLTCYLNGYIPDKPHLKANCPAF